jgi:hypothetical protein
MPQASTASQPINQTQQQDSANETEQWLISLIHCNWAYSRYNSMCWQKQSVSHKVILIWTFNFNFSTLLNKEFKKPLRDNP